MWVIFLKMINMRKFWFVVIGVFCLIVSSCTENQRARQFGGTIKVKVKNGFKVTSATWKNEDLFYFIEPMESDYKPKTKYFVEESSFGIIESNVEFIESR